MSKTDTIYLVIGPKLWVNFWTGGLVIGRLGHKSYYDDYNGMCAQIRYFYGLLLPMCRCSSKLHSLK